MSYKPAVRLAFWGRTHLVLPVAGKPLKLALFKQSKVPSALCQNFAEWPSKAPESRVGPYAHMPFAEVLYYSENT